ncbi:AsmA family protein [Sphaerotilus microaerophilus]|uniref:Cell envelope biogenesis protein AsmA n=1 Tax=Sphaerotilus microaerophilus TaxID=2914710 RepID=A0ABM7YRE3_9BURK|nr:AsmA family protein [Sphaerotilus sp. FB-5]BDI07074.1 cell envelope biogenesis protein AsmA [Sphaerotilus sp. FB-5]
MTLTRKLLLALAALLLVLVAALAWLVATFDANRYKGVAVDWMLAHHQRTLAIGDVQLRVFPRLQVELRDVSLSEVMPPPQQPQQPQQPPQRFATLASARLAVQWLPLLRQQLVVDEVQAQGLSMRYARDAQGRSNLDDLLRPAAPPQPAEPPGGRALRFDIGAIRLEQVSVDLDDRQARLRGQARLERLTTGRLAPGQPTPVNLVAQAQFSEPAVQAQVEAAMRLRLDFGDAAQPTLQVLAEAPVITFSLRAGALQLQDSRLGLQRFDFQPASQRLTLDQLAVQLQGALHSPGQAPQPLKLALNWPNLAVQGQQLQGSPLNGSFSLQGPAALEGTLSSGAPSGSFEALQVPALQLALGAATQGAGASRVRGTVRADLTARLPASEFTLAHLAIDATVQNPALQPLKVSARGQVSAAPTRVQWQLGGQMNAQAFDTDGQLAVGGPRPRLQAQARFGELDLDALLPPRPAGSASSSAGAGGPAAATADTPIDLSGLRALDAQVKLQAGTLRYRPYVLKDLSATAELDNGRLQIAPLRLRTWDGTLDARVTTHAGAAPAQQRVTVQAAAQDILIQALLQDVAQKDLLEGRGRLTLDLATGGASVDAFKRALDGSAALQLRDGAIKGINLAQRLREVKAALSRKQDAVEAAQRSEKTDFSELSASFQIHDGVAENRDLSLKSPFLRLGGEGRIDLPGSRLDYTARTTLASTSKGQGGAELDALKGLTVPVRLTGPFDAPAWHIRWSEVAVGAAGNLVKDQLQQKLEAKAADKLGLRASDAASTPLKAQVREAAKDRAREAVKERLKGLLGH